MEGTVGGVWGCGFMEAGLHVALEKVGLGLSVGRGLNQLLVRRRGVRGQACRT